MAHCQGRGERANARRRRRRVELGTGEVRDAKFRGSEFFDAHDLVQVKYEMLRRVSIEKASGVSATEEYGVSRPTYYQTKASFDEAWITGLARHSASSWWEIWWELCPGAAVRQRVTEVRRQVFGVAVGKQTHIGMGQSKYS
jgi:hypothetical protein